MGKSILIAAVTGGCLVALASNLLFAGDVKDARAWRAHLAAKEVCIRTLAPGLYVDKCERENERELKQALSELERCSRTITEGDFTVDELEQACKTEQR